MTRKPSTCKCGYGGFASNGHRWVVIERRPLPKTSKVKCLKCGWKWYSKCRYVSKLVDHVEDSRTGMTDLDILAKICNGKLAVMIKEARVFSFSHVGWAELKVITRESNGSVYQFVEVSRAGKKKKIALHRLVWMYANRSLVPAGYDVDHIEGKLVDNYNGISNLRLSPAKQNRGNVETPDVHLESYNFSDPELPETLAGLMRQYHTDLASLETSPIAAAKFVAACEALLTESESCTVPF